MKGFSVKKLILPLAAAALGALMVGCILFSAATLNFGSTTPNGKNDSDDIVPNGSLVTLTQPGTLVNLSVYLGAAAPGSHVAAALYTQSDGAPGSLLAATGAVPANSGWNTLPVSSPVSLAAGQYWLLAATDNTGSVFRYMFAASGASGWALDSFQFPNFTAVSSWHGYPGYTFDMFGTVIVAAPTATGTAPAQPTATDTAVPTATSTAQPTATSTAVPTATNTAQPTATPNGDFEATYCTATDVYGHSVCGNPPNFCDTWVGGFCNDYRNKQTPKTDPQPFPQPGDAVSLDCLGSTNAGQTSWLPYYVPTNNADNTDVAGSQIIPFPCGISFNEHFMTRMEDGQFGMVVMRQQHPFDFAGRTGHIHFEVDLKTLERRYPRLVISPQLTKVAVDDRNDTPVTAQSLEVWFRNGTFQVNETKNGALVPQFPACNGCGPRYYGTDNNRDAVDVYVSRTHIRIDVNGVTQVDTDIADIGFDVGYVYLDHLNYNSCKAYAVEGYATVAECQVDGNMFHWDDVAFDGPSLPINGLTPVGFEDVAFNAFSQDACTVKGVAATTVRKGGYIWTTWIARLPANTPVTAADISCRPDANGGDNYQGDAPGLEIVQQP